MSRGSIIKRGSTYSVVLDLGRGPDGRRVRRWHSGYRTKKDAERARTELLARVDQGSYVEPSQLTVAVFLREQWLPGLAGRFARRRCTATERTLSATSCPGSAT